MRQQGSTGVTYAQVGGTWEEVTSDPDIANSTIKISQSGGAISITGSFTYRGVVLSFRGTGTVKGDTVDYKTPF
jgi:hypothetical protein